jgi:hypothetical protein
MKKAKVINLSDKRKEREAKKEAESRAKAIKRILAEADKLNW